MDDFSQTIARHRLVALICMVVVMTFLMTSISMTLYVTSGASSLDLSRPGYVQARSEVKDDTVSKSFPSVGPLNKEEYDKYKALFDEQQKTIKNLSSYEPGPIDDTSLRLTGQPQTNE
jgi:hypothetical protein